MSWLLFPATILVMGASVRATKAVLQDLLVLGAVAAIRRVPSQRSTLTYPLAVTHTTYAVARDPFYLCCCPRLRLLRGAAPAPVVSVFHVCERRARENHLRGAWCAAISFPHPRAACHSCVGTEPSPLALCPARSAPSQRAHDVRGNGVQQDRHSFPLCAKPRDVP